MSDLDARIYGSDELEALVIRGPLDAKVWANRFVELVQECPSIATDEDTMLAWFASAIMVGYDHAVARNDLCS